jgi:hypothetical protein
MDASTGVGREEPTAWDAADYIQHSPPHHRLVDARMLHFARSGGNKTLAERIRHPLDQGLWSGIPNIGDILAEQYGG